MRLEGADAGEGTSTDRVLVKERDRVFDVLPDVLRHDDLLTDVVEGRGEDLLEGDHDGLVVRRLDALDRRQHAPDPLGARETFVGGHVVEGELDVLAAEGLAVRPLDAFAQGKGDAFSVVANSQPVANQGTISLVAVL